MKFYKRLGYYLSGFTIGLVILFFFLGGKKASCDYSPNARTLKNLRIKERSFSIETLAFLKQQQLDTSAISKILEDGNVLFSESNTDLETCKIYAVEGDVSEKTLKIKVENCETKTTVLSAELVLD